MEGILGQAVGLYPKEGDHPPFVQMGSLISADVYLIEDFQNPAERPRIRQVQRRNWPHHKGRKSEPLTYSVIEVQCQLLIVRVLSRAQRPRKGSVWWFAYVNPSKKDQPYEREPIAVSASSSSACRLMRRWEKKNDPKTVPAGWINAIKLSDSDVSDEEDTCVELEEGQSAV